MINKINSCRMCKSTNIKLSSMWIDEMGYTGYAICQECNASCTSHETDFWSANSTDGYGDTRYEAKQKAKEVWNKQNKKG